MNAELTNAARQAALALALFAAGCATMPKDYPREASAALDTPQETRLGREVAAGLQEHPGLSGLYLLGSGMDAFVSRMALAETAERTLDIQYYIFHDDLTGRLILDRLMQAADRGVRVRLLIDDLGTSKHDDIVAAISAHPNIDVRLFNPSAGRSGLSRVASEGAEFSRINHRMHNKMFVADNVAGVAGGRNIGDEYFGAGADKNFADLDLLTVGPVVQDLSRSFDAFWNSDWAVPIEALSSTKPGPDVLPAVRDALAAHRRDKAGSEYAQRLRESDLLKRLRARELPLIWAPAQVVYDKPDKAGSSGTPDSSLLLGPQLRSAVTDVRSELVISSPYFIPGESGVKKFADLRERGVRVRILTNSLAANDVAAVHSGYARYRTDLLKLGVELYEIKPALTGASEKEQKGFGSSGASLHAKTFVFDRRQLFVGSLNLDPRSLNLNTELGIVVDSPELAAEVLRGFEVLTGPLYSYRLELDPAGSDIVWISQEGGTEVRHTRDPGAGFWRRFSTWFLSFFAPESLL
jgi:putative cardiolipin synthase